MAGNFALLTSRMRYTVRRNYRRRWCEWSGKGFGNDIYRRIRRGRFLVGTDPADADGGVVWRGHVSQQVAPLCEKVGFRVVVLDDLGRVCEP